MYRTLLWYLIREMGKTFILATIGLTLMLSLGGGVRNLLKGEGLGTLEVIKVLSFVIPGAFTLSLPVAGLFGATMTYGRFSADNELNACRAAGINVHFLLTPVLVLGLFIAMITFSFTNYIIPGYVKDLNQIVGKSAFRIVKRELQTTGNFEFRGTVIHVDQFQQIENIPDSDDPVRQFAALGGAYMELSGDKPARVATTENLFCEFDRLDSDPRVRAVLSNVRGFDLEKNQFYEAEQQPFGPYRIPKLGMELKPKWMTLTELRQYRKSPDQLPRVRDGLDGLRALLRNHAFYTWIGQQLQAATGPDGEPGHVARFGRPDLWYEVRADKYAAERHTLRPRLKNPQILEHAPGRTRRITAENGIISSNYAFGEAIPMASISLDGNVAMVDSASPNKAITRQQMELPGVPILLRPPFEEHKLLDQESAFTDGVLLDPNHELTLGNQVDNARAGLIRELESNVRGIRSVLHSRSAFCFSVIVTMILGAALGIALKGGHIMTAFGISFAPALFVITTIAMGRQVAGNPNTPMIGILIIWGSVVLVGAINLVVLRMGVRR